MCVINHNMLKNYFFIHLCCLWIFKKCKKKYTRKVKRKPISYYGYTKKLCEDYILKKLNKKYIILRYFNVVGSEIKNSCGLVDKKSKQLFANLNRSILSKKIRLIYMEQIITLKMEHV